MELARQECAAQPGDCPQSPTATCSEYGRLTFTRVGGSPGMVDEALACVNWWEKILRVVGRIKGEYDRGARGQQQAWLQQQMGKAMSAIAAEGKLAPCERK